MRPGRTLRSGGQSLVEACLCIFLISMVFAGLFQLSRIFAAREILDHAANRSARAEAVGLNRFMAVKAARVAAIPIAGRMLEPAFDPDHSALRHAVRTLRPGMLWNTAVASAPVSAQADLERARIPRYLAATDEWQARHVLDYAAWDALAIDSGGPRPGDAATPSALHMTVSHVLPLWVPLHRAFYAADEIALKGHAYMERHYPLYLEAEPAYR